MPKTIELGDIVVDLIQKDIKNVHLSVYPPAIGPGLRQYRR